MFNPEITHQSEPYSTQEGCLSLSGMRETTRYEHIQVSYNDELMRSCEVAFEERVAQAIQHEIDHRNGMLV